MAEHDVAEMLKIAGDVKAIGTTLFKAQSYNDAQEKYLKAVRYLNAIVKERGRETEREREGVCEADGESSEVGLAR